MSTIDARFWDRAPAARVTKDSLQAIYLILIVPVSMAVMIAKGFSAVIGLVKCISLSASRGEE